MHRTISFVQPQPNLIQNKNNPIGCGTAPGNLVDLKKAFDSLDHTFLNTALTKLRFGPEIIEWVRLLFDEREAYILMGGHLMDKINLGQGVPQGDGNAITCHSRDAF